MNIIDARYKIIDQKNNITNMFLKYYLNQFIKENINDQFNIYT